MSEWVAYAPIGARWVLATTLLLALSQVVGPGPTLAVPTTFLFLLSCPGALLFDWIDSPSWTVLIGMALTVSLAVNILITTLLVAFGAYTPLTGLVSTVSVTVATAIVSLQKRPAKAGAAELQLSMAA